MVAFGEFGESPGKGGGLLLMRWNSGKVIGTLVYLVVKVVQLTVHFNICKFYHKNPKNYDNQTEGLESGWYR